MPFVQDLDALVARLRHACQADGSLARGELCRFPGHRYSAAANSSKSTADESEKLLLSVA